MKDLQQIYNSVKNKFYDRTKLDISEGSVIDNYTLATSSAIEEAYVEIEKNKNPHIFTNLRDRDIDSMGILVGCTRSTNEDDTSFLYRMINWNTSNQASNLTAIEIATMNMQYVSNVTYIPYTHGVATATAYIIPKKTDEEIEDLAIIETKERLQKIISPGSYVEYRIPKMLPVNIVNYIKINNDEQNVKENITKKIQTYINSLAPGSILEIGELNKIGVNEPNVEYFSISQIYIDNKEIQNIEILQKLEEKFLFNDIIWNMVVNK